MPLSTIAYFFGPPCSIFTPIGILLFAALHVQWPTEKIA